MKGSIVSEISDAKQEMDDILAQSFPYECILNFYMKTGIRIEDVKLKWIDATTLSDREPIYKLCFAKTDVLHITVQ